MYHGLKGKHKLADAQSEVDNYDVNVQSHTVVNGTSKLPPTYIVYGGNDGLVPISSVVEFRETLYQHHVRHDAQFIQDGTHYSTWSKDFNKIVNWVQTVQQDTSPIVQCLDPDNINNIGVLDGKLIFNGCRYDSDIPIALKIGTYRLKVPDTHLSDFPTTSVYITAASTISPLQQNEYFHGDVTFKVLRDFGTLSYSCGYHGAMGEIII